MLCKSRTPLQKRTTRLLGCALLVTVAITFLIRHVSSFNHTSPLVGCMFAILSVLPVIFAVWIVGRYLSREPDEFIRLLVMRALLWGIAVTMAGDAIVGVLSDLYATSLPIALLNADLFFASTGLALRAILWSYREK